MSEEKNQKIKDTLHATKERRSQMDCRVFSVKVQESKLSCAKEEKLNHVLKSNYIICFQDELLNSWKRTKSKHKFSFGRQLQQGILGRVKDKLKKNPANVMLDRLVPTTQTCPVCGCLTKHSLDKRQYRCGHCGYENSDRDIHSAKNMILLSGYGTYRSLNTDTVSTERMISLLDNLSNLGVVVTTNSMETHCL